MIVVDTNVISELTRSAPATDVVAWLDSLLAEEVATRRSLRLSSFMASPSCPTDDERVTSRLLCTGC
jgi:predicted nucleic acid-binding protein